jgi:DNA-binding CsgD family transcriptional regulator
VTTLRTEPVQRGLTALAGQGLEWEPFSRAAMEMLGRAVPFDAACMGPADPATGLLTGAAKQGLPDTRDTEFLQHEYLTDEVNLFADLARRPTPVGILADDSDGDPARSSRHRDYFMPYYSLEHELRASMVADGQVWGTLALYRSSGSSGFSPAEAGFLGRVAQTLAVGIRAGLVAESVRALSPLPAGPAVLVVGGRNDVLQASPMAELRLQELGGSAWEALPAPVGSIVAAARRVHQEGATVPRLRVRTPSGEWLVIHASPLASRDGSGTEVVVTLEEARPPEIVPLVVAAFGLTDRERDVVGGLLDGQDTREIAAVLHLSPYTVQDHLKSVFEKAGVNSRRELVARVFFDQYVPRFGAGLRPSGWYAVPRPAVPT